MFLFKMITMIFFCLFTKTTTKIKFKIKKNYKKMRSMLPSVELNVSDEKPEGHRHRINTTLSNKS